MLHARETSILKRIERSCRTIRPLQNGGREAGMAGKQRIGLPFLVVPLWFACLLLLLNKNPSANGQLSSQIFAELEN